MAKLILLVGLCAFVAVQLSHAAPNPDDATVSPAKPAADASTVVPKQSTETVPPPPPEAPAAAARAEAKPEAADASHAAAKADPPVEAKA